MDHRDADRNSPGGFARLDDRGVVAVTGPDATTFLDNLVTQDMALFAGDHRAQFAGLLSPQGKILFEFLIVQSGAGFLLDTRRDRTADLVKRLTMYRLRSKVDIVDRSDAFDVWAAWGPAIDTSQGYFRDSNGSGMVLPAGPESLRFEDPRRDQELGWRYILSPERRDQFLRDAKLSVPTVPEADWHAHRVACGVPEGGRDYPLGDTFPHEANYDRLGGVSFTKGCYVGQEVVARMENKTVVRRRVVRVAGAGLAGGAEILHGAGVVGTIGTVAGGVALAIVRLDRAVEAARKGEPLSSSGHPLAVDPVAVAAYVQSLAERPVVDL